MLIFAPFALGFSVLGLLIVANEHDGGASMTGGILSILLGAAFPLASAVNNLYTKEANRLYGRPLGDKGVRVGALVEAARQGETMANCKAIFYGGWQNETDSAPEHMW